MEELKRCEKHRELYYIQYGCKECALEAMDEEMSRIKPSTLTCDLKGGEFKNGRREF